MFGIPPNSKKSRSLLLLKKPTNLAPNPSRRLVVVIGYSPLVPSIKLFFKNLKFLSHLRQYELLPRKLTHIFFRRIDRDMKKTNEGSSTLNIHFHQVAHQFSTLVGSPWAFIFSLLVIVIWIISGPFFHYSDTWQLIINTSTTIITFLMVFLIQNTQNRDARAIHLKLDELIRATKEARNSLLDLEAMSDEDMDRLQKEFDQLKARYDAHQKHRGR